MGSLPVKDLRSFKNGAVGSLLPVVHRSRLPRAPGFRLFWELPSSARDLAHGGLSVRLKARRRPLRTAVALTARVSRCPRPCPAVFLGRIMVGAFAKDGVGAPKKIRLAGYNVFEGA